MSKRMNKLWNSVLFMFYATSSESGLRNNERETARRLKLHVWRHLELAVVHHHCWTFHQHPSSTCFIIIWGKCNEQLTETKGCAEDRVASTLCGGISPRCPSHSVNISTSPLSLFYCVTLSIAASSSFCRGYQRLTCSSFLSWHTERSVLNRNSQALKWGRISDV